jgi:hypothetical protein
MGHMTSQPFLTISCDTCVMRATAACSDCMVSAMYDHSPHEAIVLDLDEQRALRMLSAAGLIPTLRHREAI